MRNNILYKDKTLNTLQEMILFSIISKVHSFQ